jgi:hypothetical protein
MPVYISLLLVFSTGCGALMSSSSIRRQENRWYEKHGIQSPDALNDREGTRRGIGVGTSW